MWVIRNKWRLQASSDFEGIIFHWFEELKTIRTLEDP